MSGKTAFQVAYFTPDEPYELVYARQKALVQARIQDEIPDTLLLGEHPHVYTCGRKTQAAHLLATGDIPVVEIERGGDVTYHGPGQLVGYPIFKLKDKERDLHEVLRRLEAALIESLAEYQLEGIRKPGWTGVWVGEAKVASIGVAVKQWVTYHGLSLNACPDMAYFSRISPCGLPAEVMTSLQHLGVKAFDERDEMSRLQARLAAHLARVFNRQLISG